MAKKMKKCRHQTIFQLPPLKNKENEYLTGDYCPQHF